MSNTSIYSSSLYMLAARVTVKLIGLSSILVLARILLPSDFGLIAIAMSIYAFIELFGAFGFETVLIQQQKENKENFDAVWSVRLLFSIFTAVVLIIISSWAAIFFNDQRLETLISFIAFVSIINGGANVGVVQFQMDLDFRKEFIFQVLPKIASFFTIVSLAYIYKSYWALAFGILITSLSKFFLSYKMNAYRPRFSIRGLKEVFSFSKWIFLNNILFYLNTQFVTVFLGKFFPASVVGFYSIANEVSSLPTTEIAAPINKATFPMYCKLKNNISALRSCYLETISFISIITIPAAIGVALLAEKITLVFLGEKWIGSVEIMSWLALASVFLSISTNIGYVYISQNKPYFSLYINVFRALIFIPSLLILTNFYGLSGVGFSFFISSFSVFIVSIYYSFKILSLSCYEIFRPFFRPFLGSIFMSAILLYFPVEIQNKTVSLFISVITGFFSYFSSVYFLWRLSGMEQGVESKLILKVKNACKYISRS